MIVSSLRHKIKGLDELFKYLPQNSTLVHTIEFGHWFLFFLLNLLSGR